MFNLYNSYEKGIIGEKIVTEYLLSAGFKLLQNRFKTKWGEIDIIATRRACQNKESQKNNHIEASNNNRFNSPHNQHDNQSYNQWHNQLHNCLHFIEVKHKKSAVNFENFPVSNRSMKRIAESAEIFLNMNEKYQTYNMQFDIIILNSTNGQIQHMQNIYHGN